MLSLYTDTVCERGAAVTVLLDNMGITTSECAVDPIAVIAVLAQTPTNPLPELVTAAEEGASIAILVALLLLLLLIPTDGVLLLLLLLLTAPKATGVTAPPT